MFDEGSDLTAVDITGRVSCGPTDPVAAVIIGVTGEYCVHIQPPIYMGHHYASV